MNFNLPWCGHSKYWLCFKSDKEDLLLELQQKLKIKDSITSDSCIAFNTEGSWIKAWDKALKLINKNGEDNYRAVIIADEGQELDLDEILPSFERIKVINTIAENSWLGEALFNDKFVCFIQEIQDRKGQVFGYESFVRAETNDGELAGGWEIIQAAHELKIHHILDKHLQSLAIKQYSDSKLKGSIFLNFITGFIQLPERYLESLNKAVKKSDFIPKRVVLDLPISDMLEDHDQLAAIIDYCNSKGYSVALDDVKSADEINQILESTTPDYIKIDRGLTSNYTNDSVKGKIKEIIEQAGKKGCMVIAEGIEDKKTFTALHKMGADLFQGYYFAKPMSISDVVKANSKSKAKKKKSA